MKIIIQVSNREAIPIRAIPFVTGWMMSPDVVAKAFAHTDSWVTKLVEVYAFNLSDDGSYAQTLPKEWDGIIAELESLSNMYQMDESYEGGNYVAWRRDSVPLLPPACFVWKDEFEKAFEMAYSEKKLILIDERLGDRELNFSPLIPKKLQGVVMEGFESSVKDDVKQIAEKPLTNKERESIVKIIHALAKNGYKYPNHGALAEIVRDFQTNHNGVSENTLTKYLKEFDSL